MAEKLKLGGHTTVDIDDLSGDEPRLARHQEQNQVRNIFRVARSGYDLHQIKKLFECMMPDVRIGDCSARGPRRHDMTRPHTITLILLLPPTPAMYLVSASTPAFAAQ